LQSIRFAIVIRTVLGYAESRPNRQEHLVAVCEHLAHSRYIAPKAHVCAECIAMGDTWVHLRTCLTCGHVGCCDSSKNKHATRHFHNSGHAVIASAERGERWLWCYVDEQFVE
jgi:uncharacterized UBP type Zn finger protein